MKPNGSPFRKPSVALVATLLFIFGTDRVLVFAQEQSVVAPDRPTTENVDREQRLAAVQRMWKDAEHYANDGRILEAIAIIQKVVPEAESLFGTDSIETVRTLLCLGKLHSAENSALAETFLRRAYLIAKKPRCLSPYDSSSTMTAIANYYDSRYKYSEAEAYAIEAFELLQQMKSPDPVGRATLLRLLGRYARIRGEYARAKGLFQEAMEISMGAAGEDTNLTANCINSLATIYNQLGDYSKAEDLYRRALETSKRTVGVEHQQSAIIISNIAENLASQEYYEASEALFNQAIGILQGLSNSDKAQIAYVENVFASCHLRSENKHDALKLLKHSLKLYEESLGKDHAETAIVRGNLGECLLQLGNLDEAEAELKASIRMLQESFGPAYHPNELIMTRRLAHVLECKSSPNTQAIFDRAHRMQHQYVMSSLPFLSEEEQLLFLNSNTNNDSAFSYGLRNRDKSSAVVASAAWQLNAKGLSQESVSRRVLAFRSTRDTEVSVMVSKISDIHQRLSQLAMVVAEPSRKQVLLNEVANLRKDEVRLQQELQSLGSDSLAKWNWVEFEDLRTHIPDKAIFVDIARFDLVGIGNEQERKENLPHYAAWITPATGGGDVRLVDLGSATEVDALVYRLRENLQSASGEIERSGEEIALNDLNDLTQELAAKIWWPLVPHLKNAQRIILSPDGDLWFVPWAALPNSKMKDEARGFLIENFAIQLVVSGRDMVRNQAKTLSGPSVLFANPRFTQTVQEKASSIKAILSNVPADAEDSLSFSVSSRLDNVVDLPYTESEVLSLQPSLDKLTGKTSVIFKQQYALESVVKAVRGPQVAVFATHGFFFPTKDGQIPALDSPLLRCGLLLSGCTTGGESVANDDGILTGLEVVGCDFGGTELIVLSSCETGLGQINDGEGVAGLRQAFQLAGARSVLASLWHVSDRETALMMADFFGNLAKGQTKVDALRSAQLEIIKHRKAMYGAAHPYYWAAFTLTGSD